MAKRERHTKIGEQFAAIPIAMVRSPVMAVLTLSERRALDRLQVEFADHGGTENGTLPVTYNDFVEFGIDRHAVFPSLRVLQNLGFIEITEVGRGGAVAEFHSPSLYRLTFRHTQYAGPTHEWRRIENIEDAKAIARAARQTSAQMKRKASREKRLIPVGKTPTETANAPVGENPTTVPVGKTPTTIYISGEVPDGRVALAMAGIASAVTAHVSRERSSAAKAKRASGVAATP
jgi:hypothetical protein